MPLITGGQESHGQTTAVQSKDMTVTGGVPSCRTTHPGHRQLDGDPSQEESKVRVIFKRNPFEVFSFL